MIGAPARRFLKVHRGRMVAQRVGNDCDAVFPLPAGRKYETVRTIWFAIRRAASLSEKLRIHDLRHSFASHAVISGETLLTTSHLLGHQRVQTTFR